MCIRIFDACKSRYVGLMGIFKVLRCLITIKSCLNVVRTSPSSECIESQADEILVLLQMATHYLHMCHLPVSNSSLM